MLRVAAIGEYILSKNKIKLNLQPYISCLLLHDIGNLIKINPEQDILFFTTKDQDSQKWSIVRNEMIKSYGSDEKLATLKMIKKICNDEKIIKIINFLDLTDISQILKINDIGTKVCIYSDFRVGLNSFVSLTERFADILCRYKNRPGFAGKEMVLQKKIILFKLEKQIENTLQINLRTLPQQKLISRSYELLHHSVC